MGILKGARDEFARGLTGAAESAIPILGGTGSLRFLFGLQVRRDRQFSTGAQKMTAKTSGSNVCGSEAPTGPGRVLRGSGVRDRGAMPLRRTVAGFFVSVSVSLLVFFCLLVFLLLSATSAFAQGGPPYYTNDPGTPGPFNWEINLGYMPFFYSGQPVSHTPDVDINFGIGDRIQLTYENAWLRVQNPSTASQFGRTQFGLGQSNPGVKWRFYDAGEDGLSVSVFPQFFLNNPNDAVRRGITPASQSFLLPFEFSKKLGPVDVDYEIGYQIVHKGPNGWLTGLVVGHDFTPKLEGDIEFYNQGTFHSSENQPSVNQPTIDFGARYKIHSPIIFLVMAGRSLEPARSNQAYFLGYFGIQILLPPKSYK
jgi:hypothetical protein